MILVFFVTCLCSALQINSYETIHRQKKNSKDVTLITAFFDVGVRRSRDIYFSYFKNWALIKNRLIVFCQNKKNKEEILSVRRNYGLENETSVTIIEKFFNIEEEMYNKMIEISINTEFLNFRVYKKLFENTAEYNYVNYMKVFFLNKANVEYEIETENLGWIDFGFDHGGVVYLFRRDWLFKLECETSGKIILFHLPPKLDQRPLFEIIRTCHSHPRAIDKGLITGCFFVCPKILVNDFWTLMKESIHYFLCLGLMDDDQPVLLLTSKRNPQLFELKLSEWFHALEDHCNGKRTKTRLKDQDKHYLRKKKRVGTLEVFKK